MNFRIEYNIVSRTPRVTEEGFVVVRVRRIRVILEMQDREHAISMAQDMFPTHPGLELYRGERKIPLLNLTA